MGTIDWLVFIGVILLTGMIGWSVKRYMLSVADFLAANRSAGRYLLTVSEGMAGLGAITVLALMEVTYKAGFSPHWWGPIGSAIVIVLSLSGWVIYRFRRTRCLTMAQFFEIRYSRNFRILAGIIAFVSGILNFGIFPRIGTQFFMYYCNIPQTWEIVGINIPSFPLVMVGLISFALLLAFFGGQIAVMVTDFFQGSMCNIAFLLVAFFLLYKVGWSDITETVISRPAGQSFVNPFDTGDEKSFNFAYAAIWWFITFYDWQAWQGVQGYNVSAKNAHEARMGKILGEPRNFATLLLFVFVPIAAYTIMNHPNYHSISESVNLSFSMVENQSTVLQMTTPVVLSKVLPLGLVGLFAAAMFAAAVSTHDTFMHSWGSVFIQDVVMPFRKTPFTPKQHIKLLRLSIIGVAVFIFTWSMLIDIKQHIWMFLMFTGAIYLGGAGSVIIGGLYWKRGTTAGAYSALITAASIAMTGFILKLSVENFPIDGQWCFVIATASAIVAYVIVSLLSRKGNSVDYDRMFHRGKYILEDEEKDSVKFNEPGAFSRILGITKEFNLKDKFIYFGVMLWGVLWVIVFAVGTIIHLTYGISDRVWAIYWRINITIYFMVSTLVSIWLITGGLGNIKELFKRLREIKRNDLDDGSVVDRHNLGE